MNCPAWRCKEKDKQIGSECKVNCKTRVRMATCAEFCKWLQEQYELSTPATRGRRLLWLTL